jgi:hypothetical protein
VTVITDSSDATCGTRQALQLACQPLGGCRASAMRSARAAALADGPNRRWRRGTGSGGPCHSGTYRLTGVSDDLTEISLTGCLQQCLASFVRIERFSQRRQVGASENRIFSESHSNRATDTPDTDCQTDSQCHSEQHPQRSS